LPQKPKKSSKGERSWRDSLLPVHSTMQQAIRNLSDSSLQIALVVSPEGFLVGTITDGDIRRGLLKGKDMKSPIDGIIFREPLVVPPEVKRETMIQIMLANKIHSLPIIDENRKVLGLHQLDNLLAPRQRPNLMVIMAGGQGSRLRPHTENCPKPLLKVDGKPMLEYIIERAKGEGFQYFILAIQYLGHMIEEYCGNGSQWNVRIDYLREESPLGTAGAIGLLDPCPEAPFVVSNGDVLTDIHYGELLDFHCQHGASATMAVRLHEWQNPFGVVHAKGVDIIGFEEKPVIRNHINAGVYVLDPQALSLLSKNEYCDMPTLFERLQEGNDRTIIYPMHEPWLDVGREDDLGRAQALKRSRKT
jgi:dTDP-glucose pyrophosphorylase